MTCSPNKPWRSTSIFNLYSGQNRWRREAVEDKIFGAEEGEAGEGEAVGERKEVPGAQGGGGEEKEAGEGAPGQEAPGPPLRQREKVSCRSIIAVNRS